MNTRTPIDATPTVRTTPVMTWGHLAKPQTAPQDLDIDPLSVLCKTAHAAVCVAVENALKETIRFGELLCIAKTKIVHGGWAPWVAKTFDNQVSLRSIQRAMQIAESNTTDLTLLEGVKNQNEALALIQSRRDQRIASRVDDSDDQREPATWLFADKKPKPEPEQDAIVDAGIKSQVEKPVADKDVNAADVKSLLTTKNRLVVISTALKEMTQEEVTTIYLACEELLEDK